VVIESTFIPALSTSSTRGTVPGGDGDVGILHVTLVVADLTNGIGRFNLAQGLVGTMSALGAALHLSFRRSARAQRAFTASQTTLNERACPRSSSWLSSVGCKGHHGGTRSAGCTSAFGRSPKYRECRRRGASRPTLKGDFDRYSLGCDAPNRTLVLGQHVGLCSREPEQAWLPGTRAAGCRRDPRACRRQRQTSVHTGTGR